jgi:hypothetical protein
MLIIIRSSNTIKQICRHSAANLLFLHSRNPAFRHRAWIAGIEKKDIKNCPKICFERFIHIRFPSTILRLRFD